VKTVSLKEKADILIRDHSFNIIGDVLGFQPRKNKPFVFSDDSKNGNDYLFQHPQGFYGIKNFATDEFYNPIQAYQLKYNCDFTSAVSELGQKYLIYSDASLNHQPRQEFVEINDPETKPFIIKKKDFDVYDTAFWLKYGIHTATLEDYGVSSLESYTFQSNGSEMRTRSSEENPIYAYRVTDDCYKIYQPLKPKFKFRWLGDKPVDFFGIFGIDQLPSHCRILLICEGLKDALAVIANRNLFGEDVWAVGKDNAQADIHPEIVEILKSKADELILCLDNDQAGKAATQKHSARHQLRFIELPKVYHCKDIAELLEAYHQQKQGITQSFFVNIVDKTLKTDPHLPDFDELDDIDKVLFRSDQVMKAINSTIHFRKPLLERENVGIIYPYTINLIQGGYGTHKSRLAETICSTFLSRNSEREFIGFKRTGLNPEDIFVVYVDSERNVRDQLPYALQRMIVNAGYSPDSLPSNFKSLPLVDIQRENRFHVLEKLIRQIKEKTDKHLAVVLDVVTDCNQSFNDAKDSLTLVDMMNKMINRDEITFICIIHENFGMEKARGHLGSEISNKSTTIIQVKKEEHNHGATDEDIYRLRFLKSRMTRRPKDYFIYYDQGSKGLQEVEDVEVLQSLKKEKSVKAPVGEVKLALCNILTNPLNQNELIEELQKEFDASANTLKDRLKMIQDGEVIVTADRSYRFSISTGGRSTIYAVKECNNKNNQTSEPI
jgi:hypothetical protein